MFKVMKIDLFLVFLAVWVFSPNFWAGYWVLHVVVCPIVFILFYGRDWQGGVLKLFLAVLFLGPFPQDWGVSMLKPHKMKSVLHVVPFPIVFILFDHWDSQGGMLSSKKWSFFSIFRRLGPFPQMFGQVMLELHKMMSVSNVVACPIIFILFYERNWQGGVSTVMKKWSFISRFSCLGHFPKGFGQVNEWLVLELHKMMSVSNNFFFMSGVSSEECS